MPHGTLAEALQELDSDDAAAVVEDLEDDQRERVLAAMPEVDRAAIESSLGYAEESAGRLMQREVMAAPQFWSVGDTIDHIRKQGDGPARAVLRHLCGRSGQPAGPAACPSAGLLRAARDVALTDLMEPINAIAVDQDQEEVAYIFEKYHLISAPVVDAGGRLVGQITVDDISTSFRKRTARTSCVWPAWPMRTAVVRGRDRSRPRALAGHQPGGRRLWAPASSACSRPPSSRSSPWPS